MTKAIYIFFILLYSVQVISQNSEIDITVLKPTTGENKFPVVTYNIEPKIEDKINTLLQLKNLRHLPNHYKANPFEKVEYSPDNSVSVMFYGFQKIITPKNILSIIINGEATGSYTESFESYYNFDLRTGNVINLTDFLTEDGIKQITKKLNLKVKKEINNFLVHLDKTSEDDIINGQLNIYTNCLENIEHNSIESYTYYFKKNGITFIRGRCSNHAMRALDDLGQFEISFSYNELKIFLSEYGSGLLNQKNQICKVKSQSGKFYKGKIDNKYPITVFFISKVYTDESLSMSYWYDKYKTPIKWNGKLTNNHFSLIEYDYYDEEKNKWVLKAKIQADLINDTIIGTWTNLETKEILKIKLIEY